MNWAGEIFPGGKLPREGERECSFEAPLFQGNGGELFQKLRSFERSFSARQSSGVNSRETGGAYLWETSEKL